MRKLLIFIFSGLFFVSTAQDAGWVKIALPLAESVSELSISDGEVSFNLGISELGAGEVFIARGSYAELAIPQYFNVGLPGEPSLPVYSSLFEKNYSGAYQVQIHSLDSMMIDLNDYFDGAKIIPSQPSVQKGRSAGDEEFIKNEAIYRSDEWISPPLVSVVDEGIMRGVHIGRVYFNLLHYNPGRNLLKIYYNISGSLIPEHPPSTLTKKPDSGVFDKVLSSVLREANTSFQKKLLKEQPVKMVILSDSIFSEALQPLINWKRKKGFHVIEAYTDDPLVGSDRISIQTYLSDLYHNSPDGVAPSYLLIVGDVEHVPLSQGSGQITDLYYTTYDGDGDFLPDLFQGRISVKTDAQLTAVVDKILDYEQYKFPDPTFLNRSILIAGYDGSHAPTWGNGQITYAANYYFNSSHGIEANIFLHPEASDSAAVIREAVSEGASLVNYTGHGEYYGWINPAFRTSHIAGLGNSKKYPVLIGNGCSTNIFSMSSDCFAEAVVKAEGKGALAYIGCTNDSYWDEDYFWAVGIGAISANPLYEQTGTGFYDKIFHDGAEPVDEWTPSLGEMIFGGNMVVQQSGSPLIQYYWEIYQLMGDPSLVPWFTEPENPDVVYPASLAPDASLIALQAEAYDYSAISVDGILLDAKHADTTGKSSLFIPEEYRGDTILLVVTGDHRQPFIRQIPDVGHFELVDLVLGSESINQDSLLSNGEEVSLNIKLSNTSVAPSDVCNLILRGSENITLLDSLVLLPVVNPGDTLELLSAFTFKVNDAVMDQSIAHLSFIRENDITLNTMEDEMLLHAPLLKVKSVNVNDDLYGNGNSVIESGEHIVMSFELENQGSYKSDSIELLFGAGDTIFDEKLILKGQELIEGTTKLFSADILIPDLGETMDFYMVPIIVSDGNYFLEEIFMVIGKYIEDFSLDSLWLLPWTELGWYRDTSEYYTGPASLRSNEIDHRESTSAELKVHVFDPDSLEFRFKVSSEDGYDHLRFYVDGEEIFRISGNTGWQHYSHMLNTGLHDIKWTYIKDGNTIGGEDAAWIDNVIFPANAFVPDLYIDSIIVARIGPSLDEESFSILVNNIGLDTINDFLVRYRTNDEIWEEQAFVDTLAPGIMKKIHIPGTVDLSEVREHTLHVVLRSAEDIWPWNDTLEAKIDHYAYPDLSISYLDYDSSSGNYVNLVALIENEGNVPVESFLYNVLIDNEFNFVGKSTIDLDPGSSTEASLNLINEYHEWLETGWHDYRVDIAEDSVLDNNTLNGSVFWIVSSSVELNGWEGIQLYPNPTKEVLFIDIPEDMALPGAMAIQDIQGRDLVLEELNSYHEEVSLGTLLPSDGIYIISIRNVSGEQVFKGRFIYVR